MVRKVVIPATISVRTFVLFSLSLNSCSSIRGLPVDCPPSVVAVCGHRPVQNQPEWASVCLCGGCSLQSAAMLMSQYFLATMKDAPWEAQIVSPRLMLRAGLVRQTSAGIYAWLPLGLRVLKNIERIVREEQDASGAQEVLMPTIQSAELWRESGRYD